MEHTDFDGIIFADTLQDFNALRHTGRVIHILCSGGGAPAGNDTTATSYILT